MNILLFLLYYKCVVYARTTYIESFVVVVATAAAEPFKSLMMKYLLAMLKCLIGRKTCLLWYRKSGNTCNNILIIRYSLVSLLNAFHMVMEERAKGNLN